jgi:hypothetical protein
MDDSRIMLTIATRTFEVDQTAISTVFSYKNIKNALGSLLTIMENCIECCRSPSDKSSHSALYLFGDSFFRELVQSGT